MALKVRFIKRKINTVFSFLALLVIILSFQNCSNDTAFDMSEAELASQARGIGENSFIINNGDEFTNNISVSLKISAVEPTEMYITNDPSCESGGQWEAIAQDKSWNLATPNSLNSVFIKFKKTTGFKEFVSDCISDSITHDAIAPTLSFKEKPARYVALGDARFVVVPSEDLSGVRSYECKFAEERFYSDCTDIKVFQDLREGEHLFHVRALDRAGNRSSVLEHIWAVDQTPPVLSINSKPAAISSSSVAVFKFTAVDEASGVDSTACSVDGGAPKICSSPVTFSNLKEGNHVFSIQTMDKVGNKSQVINYSWKTQGSATSDFEVLGITGGADVFPDQYLGNVRQPTVTWTASMGAVVYRVSILDAAGAVTVCAEAETTVTGISFPRCSLTNGVSYKARVAAYSSTGAIKVAALFSFIVDTNPPVITAKAPIVSEDQKQVTFPSISITDSITGIESATCKRLFGATTKTISNCHTQTKLTFTDLVTGSYKLVITAADKAGNVSSTSIDFVSKKVICDPFSKAGYACKQGWKGEIRYFHDTTGASGWSNLAPYFTHGHDANAVLYMSQIFVPVRTFSNGFPTTDGELLKKKPEHGGGNLIEYFALRMKTVMKLKEGESSGYYQFALISDDGSKLYIANDKTSPYVTVIDNDQNHAATMKCSAKAIYMTANSRLPARLEYFQGPRTRIALNLVYRKVSSATPSASSPCGVTDPLFYGSADNYTGVYTGSPYQKALEQGWKSMEPGHFLNDETIPF
ncbi:OmpL47-type beta-barrel domain-containing protein [Bdellovibrio bacteriovorus]